MSSTPSKRLNDDGGNQSGNHGHSSATKYQHDDSSSFAGIGAKMTSSVSGEFHVPYEAGQESRMPKYPRTESRDADRRMPSFPVFGVPSSSVPASHDHLTGRMSRLDFQDPKDSYRDHKFENRESKVELRDLYQTTKAGDVKFESRGNDRMDTKDGPFEHRSDLRTDKEAYGGASTHSSCKESGEQLRGKRYFDAFGSNMNQWQTSRTNLHLAAEEGKDATHIEEKSYAESREAVGENKVDMKGEDKYSDKDRKRKEGKHHEWGERDKDRNDRRNDSENKDLINDERKTERWEKERKDLPKEKEKLNRHKDYIKKEAGTGSEKVGLHSDNDLLDVPRRAAELENLSTELKNFKDGDDQKIGDKDPRDKNKDGDMDSDRARFDKRNRHQDKESDEACGDVDDSTEKEREGFTYGLQQHLGMLRPKGNPQCANRNLAFRPHNHDNNGSQGEADVSIVIYKVGECMHDLMKLWKEYESSQANRMSESSFSGPTLDIWISAEHVSATNRQVRGGQLWGTDIYTNDSDLVAVLMHTGYCRPTASPPPSTVQELRATIRVLPPQDSYNSTLRNNVRSRAWGFGIGCSYRVECCCIAKKEGGTINLEPCLTHSSTLEPTLAPVAVERTMTTRAAASNALRQQRFVREITIQFNLCCEPWRKYSISVVADKGLKKANYTSSRLKKGEVLYLETHSCRYELSFNGEKMVKSSTPSKMHVAEADKSQAHYTHTTNGERGGADGEVTDVFRWSRCKKALPQRMMKSIGIPLPLEHVEVLEDNLVWEDIGWASTSVHINGKEYALSRAHFLSPAFEK